MTLKVYAGFWMMPSKPLQLWPGIPVPYSSLRAGFRNPENTDE